MPALLRVDALEAGYGDLLAVRAVSLEVYAGEIVALIGSNGAGKTTTLRTIGGLLRLRRGVIELDGARIDGLSAAQIVARGVAHVPEGRQLFPTMTVQENLELGARTPESRRRRTETIAEVFRLFPRLEERRRQLAGTLSGGEQQMCAIGRALAARPRLLLLDEPSLGLAPVAWPRSTAAASPSCWSSRTCCALSGCPIAPMCSKMGPFRSPAPLASSLPTKASGERTSADSWKGGLDGAPQ